MEQVNHQLANTFWKTHFPELIDTTLTERQALDSDFWMKLQTAFDASDPDTLWAVLLTNIPMRLEVSYMFTRITTSAKQTWHKKTDPIYRTKS
jgi:hypothetical protein